MNDLELVLVLACVLVLVSILASKASGRSGVPALLLFLGIGMLAGSEGLGGIDFDNASPRPGGRRRRAGVDPVLGRAGHALGRRPADPRTRHPPGHRRHPRDRRTRRGCRAAGHRPVPRRVAAARRGRLVDRRRRRVLRAARAQGETPGTGARPPGARIGQQRPDGGLPDREPHHGHHRGRRLAAGVRRLVRPADGPRGAARVRLRAGHGLGDQPDRSRSRRPLSRAQPRARPARLRRHGLRGRQRVPRRLRRRHRHGRQRPTSTSAA